MKDTQHKILIDHFTTRSGGLTVASAISRYGIYALSQRCGELRRMGFPIKDRWLKLSNNKIVKEYSM